MAKRLYNKLYISLYLILGYVFIHFSKFKLALAVIF